MFIKKLAIRTLVICGLSLLLIACSQQNISQKPSTGSAAEQFADEETLEVQTIDGNHYIAIAAPLTGPYKELGNSIIEGATIAVEEFNDSEANSNHRIGTLIIDDGGQVAEGLARADLVIAQKALGVIGHLNSAISIETSKKYSKANIVEISPASTNPKLTERPDVKGYVYRTIGTDRQLGEVAAEYVISNPQFKKIAVLYNDRPYGVSVSSEFVRELAKDSSKELVLYQTIPVRTHDHSPTAAKVANAKADLVFFIGEYNDAGYLLKDLKAKLPNVQFLGAEGVHHHNFIDIASNNAEGALVIGAGPAPRVIQEKYESRYKKPSTGYVGTSYNATKLLLDAIKANKYKDPAGIAKSIGDNKIFDPNGDLIQPDFVIYKVEGSKFVI